MLLYSTSNGRIYDGYAAPPSKVHPINKERPRYFFLNQMISSFKQRNCGSVGFLRTNANIFKYSNQYLSLHTPLPALRDAHAYAIRCLLLVEKSTQHTPAQY